METRRTPAQARKMAQSFKKKFPQVTVKVADGVVIACLGFDWHRDTTGKHAKVIAHCDKFGYGVCADTTGAGVEVIR